MSEREQIEQLLPWYVTGKLDAEDNARVEAYLSAHPEMASQLGLVEEEVAATVEVNELAGSPALGSSQRFMERIDQEFGTQDRQAGAGWLATQLAQLRQALQMPVARYAAMAAVVVIAVQAVTIGTLSIDGSDNPGYQTASGGNQTATGNAAHLLLSFVPEATAAEITKLLEEIDGIIVSGPKGGNFYEIRITKESVSEQDLDKLVDALSKRDKLVGFVSTVE